MLLQNVFLSQDYVELHPRKQNYSSHHYENLKSNTENDNFCVGYLDKRGDICIKRLPQVTDINIMDSLTGCSSTTKFVSIAVGSSAVLRSVGSVINY
jgi:hypothetical protein